MSATVVPSPALLTSLSDASQEPRDTWFESEGTWLVDYYEMRRLCGGFVNGKLGRGYVLVYRAVLAVGRLLQCVQWGTSPCEHI